MEVPVLAGILPSNERQIQPGVNRVLVTKRRRVGVLGLAFKEGTDDLRESPMVRVVETLIRKGCDIRILDRNVAIARPMTTWFGWAAARPRRASSLAFPTTRTSACESRDLTRGTAGL